MRIVSQDKRIDLPYDKIAITSYGFYIGKEERTSIWAAPPHANDELRCYLLGRYSNEQAKEVMQLIRDAWQEECEIKIVEGNTVNVNENVVFEMPAERRDT